MSKISKLLNRVFSKAIDPSAILNIVFNESAGTLKISRVPLAVKRPYRNGEEVPFGSYIKINGGGNTARYHLRCVNKAYDPNYQRYRKGDIVTFGTGTLDTTHNVYIAARDFQSGVDAGPFDSSKWIEICPAVIENVLKNLRGTGNDVSLGKYHNSIRLIASTGIDPSNPGWLLDDDSSIKSTR